jgi:hypothetical protein
MKKIIFITLALFNFITEKSHCINTQCEIKETIYLRQNSIHNVKPKSTGPHFSPIHATINEDIINILFNIDIQNLNIHIENKEGDIVYDNTLSAPASTILPISIKGYESGEYLIEIKYEDTNLYGTFYL